jgi:hypothetical protein
MGEMRNGVRKVTLQMTRKHYRWFPFPEFPLLGDFIGRAEEELWREDGREAVLLLPRHRRPANKNFSRMDNYDWLFLVKRGGLTASCFFEEALRNNSTHRA